MKSILVIEDCDSIRLLIQRVNKIAGRIWGHGVSITEAKTLKEGVFKMQTEGPDVVVLDLTFPDSRQYETVNKIRELATPDGPPIVVLSGEPSNAVRAQCLANGAASYIYKDAAANVVCHSLIEQCYNEWLKKHANQL